MSARTCPDWPELLELAPDLLFKHYTAAEAQLPADALVNLETAALESLALCCDLDKNVFNPEHTDERVAEALRASHWFDLREWVARGPGSAA